MGVGIWSKRILRYGGIALVIAVVMYIGWIGWNGWVTSSICAGICLVLFAAVLFNYRRQEIKADRDIAQRIKTDFPAESQSEVLGLYHGLKMKELECLFAKVLDDAKGDIREARKLSALAESTGWKAFLENRW